MIITNKYKSANISIPNPFDQNTSIDLLINKNKNTKVKVKFINNTPYITIAVSLNAHILSVSGNSETLDDKIIETIEKQINLYLQEKIYNYLYKTTLDFDSDVCEFGNYATHNFLTTKEWNNYNWKSNYKNSLFKVTVKSNLKSGILLTQD